VSQPETHLLVNSRSSDNDGGSRVLALVEVDDLSSARERFERLRAALLDDRFRARLLSVRQLRYRAFDFEADHPSVREMVLNELAQVHHESYVSVSPRGGLSGPSDRWEWYRRTLNRLLSGRLTRTAGKVCIYIDEGVEFAVDKTSMRLSAAHVQGDPSPSPEWARLRIRTFQQTDCLRTIPSYIGGGVCWVMERGPASGEMKIDQFQRLVSRVRVISDTDRGIIYSGDEFWRRCCGSSLA
jgi:hypothetical protein